MLSEGFRRRYRLGRFLGGGAMGTVFLATDVEDGGLVAIKFLAGADDPERLARFLREGELLKELEHPNVLRLFESGEQQGYPYLVTEYLEGGSLSDRLQERPCLPLSEALAIACDCLEGLAACHSRGVVHRDIKPENILFTGSGEAKIGDLGIARAPLPSGSLTETGAVVGTPRYMSPEQVKSMPAGPASDIYALGVVLYQMLAGRPPFVASDLYTLMRMHAEESPPKIEAVAAGVPDEIARLVHQTLEKDPSRRPTSAAGLAADLRHASGMPVRPAASAWPKVAAPVPLRAKVGRRHHALPLVLILLGVVVWRAAAHRWPESSSSEDRAARSPSPRFPPPTIHVSPPDPSPSVTAAETYYLAMLAKSPEDTTALDNLSRVYEKQGRLDQAERYQRRAVAREPRRGKFLSGLAVVLEKRGKVAEAEQAYRSWVALEPTRATPERDLGTFLIGQNRLPDAETHLRRAVAHDPTDHVAFNNLGDALRRQARRSPPEALDACRRVAPLHALHAAPGDGASLGGGVPPRPGGVASRAGARPLTHPPIIDPISLSMRDACSYCPTLIAFRSFAIRTRCRRYSMARFARASNVLRSRV
jgi:serine/threonine-protein kinase